LVLEMPSKEVYVGKEKFSSGVLSEYEAGLVRVGTRTNPQDRVGGDPL
jgi:hypothetical protein